MDMMRLVTRDMLGSNQTFVFAAGDSVCLRVVPKGRWSSNRGAAMLMVVFVIALLATAVSGIIQMNTEEIQVMTNHIGMAQARTIAEAGLQHALSEKRMDPHWRRGFRNRRFADGRYTVTVDDWTITSTGQSPQGFQMRVTANITILGSTPPHPIRIDALRINQ